MDKKLEQDVQTIWTLLMDIVTNSEKRLAVHLAQHDLTPPQFFVLRTLTQHGGRCPIGHIAREHHLTNATMTGLVNRLSDTKPPLVARERSTSDGRSIDVVLTEAGIARFEAIEAGLLEQVRLLLGLLDETARHNLIEQVSHYVNLIFSVFPIHAPD